MFMGNNYMHVFCSSVNHMDTAQGQKSSVYVTVKSQVERHK